LSIESFFLSNFYAIFRASAHLSPAFFTASPQALEPHPRQLGGRNYQAVIRFTARAIDACLDGKLWLPEVGKATHYHAYLVPPSWVREMHKLHRLGVHTFYRPRDWAKRLLRSFP
jgi:hypothetical protein